MKYLLVGILVTLASVTHAQQPSESDSLSAEQSTTPPPPTEELTPQASSTEGPLDLSQPLTEEQQESLRRSIPRDWHIANIYQRGQLNDRTCTRVNQFSKGDISGEECAQLQTEANAACIELIQERIPQTPTDVEASQIARILAVCPMAKILGYPLRFVDGKVKMDVPSR